MTPDLTYKRVEAGESGAKTIDGIGTKINLKDPDFLCRCTDRSMLHHWVRVGAGGEADGARGANGEADHVSGGKRHAAMGAPPA